MAGRHRIVQQHMLISSKLKLKPAQSVPVCLKYEFCRKNCAAKT